MLYGQKILLSFIVITLGFLNEIVGQLDTLHYIPPMHSRLTTQIEDHYLYLSTPEAIPFEVNVKDGSGIDIPGSPFILSNAAPVSVLIGNGQVPATKLMVDFSSLNKTLFDKGLIISGKDPFYANSRYRSGSQAEALTSKGLASAGTEFRIGMMPVPSENSFRNFVIGIMATEDGTDIDISNYDSGVVFHGTPQITSDNLSISLDAGQCYVLSGYTSVAANLDGMIGALVESNNPIVINTGNMCGTIGPGGGGQDMALDQIAPTNKMGNKYIIVEGQGNTVQERPMIVAHYDDTEVFINGSGAPEVTLQAGEWYLVNNSEYTGGAHQNMYINLSEPAYVYQFMAGSTNNATPGMNFMPPVDCSLPHEVDLIPDIDKIGGTTYTGGIVVITEAGSTLTINGNTQSGAQSVTGNPDWETYKILNLTGDIAVSSTGGVCVGIYGQSGVAGFGGFYAGFSSVLDVVTSNDTTFCEQDADVVTISAEVDGGIPPYEFSWNQGLGSGPVHTVFPTTTTEYVVTVTDGSQCTSTDKIIVEINVPPLLELTPDETLCDGDLITIGVETNGAAGPLDYTWNEGLGNSPTHDVDPNESTLYMVTVTDANGCSSTGDIQIDVNPSPSVEIQGDSVVCEGVNTVLDAGPGFINYSWSTGENTQSIFPEFTTIYLVTVTDINNCTATDAINFELSLNPIVDVGEDQSICEGENAILVGDVLLGVQPYLYQWDQGLGEGETHVVFPDETTTYTLTVIDDLGCFGFDEVTIEVNPPAQVEITGDSELCDGLSSQLDAGDGFFTYEWNNGSEAQSITVDSSGFYLVTITDENGCTGTDFFEVTIADSLLPVVLGDLTICSGQINIINSGDIYANYIWNTGDSTNTISIDEAGIYSLTVTNNAGCMGSTIVEAELLESPEIDLVEQSSICEGESIDIIANLTAGAAPADFIWNDGSLTGDSLHISPTEDTTYELMVIDTNGCFDSADISIIVNENPNLTTGEDAIICLGDSLEVSADASGGNSPYSFEWNNALGLGQVHQVLPSMSSTFTVSITDAVGCGAVDSMEVFVTPGIDGSISGATEFCFGNSSELSVPEGYFSYTWSTGDSTTNLTVGDPGVYSITVMDEYGCMVTEEVDVYVLDSLVPAIQGAFEFCEGESVTLSLEASYQNYMWSTGETSNSIEISDGGVYTIQVFNDDGCNGRDEVIILENENPTVATPLSVEICAGETTILDVTVTNGIGPYDYSWDQGLGGGMEQIVSPSTSTNYNVTVTDSNECSAESMLPVIVKPLPVASTQHVEEICINDALEIQFNGTTDGDNQYTWQFDGANVISGSGIGPYMLDYQDAGSYGIQLLLELNGCRDSTSSIVVVNPLTNSLTEIEACDWYQWNGQDYYESGAYVFETTNIYGCDSTARLELEIHPSYESSFESIVCFEDETGTSIYELTTTFGCDSMVTEIFVLGPEISVNLGNDITINYGEVVDLEARLGGAVNAVESVSWQGLEDNSCPDCLTQSYYPQDSATITVYIIDENGCVFTDQVNIRVIQSDEIFSPNIISPNGDGINDFFFLQGNPNRIDQINSMYVFDRWGNRLFEAANLSINAAEDGWDGTYLGEPLNPAVFVWFAEVLLDDGTVVVVSGDVTISR